MGQQIIGEDVEIRGKLTCQQIALSELAETPEAAGAQSARLFYDSAAGRLQLGTNGGADAAVGAGLGPWSFSETVHAADLTDGGAAAGTYSLRAELPAGAILLGLGVRVPAGFAEDTSAVLKIEDGGAIGTIADALDVFDDAPDGLSIKPAGAGTIEAAAQHLALTITSDSDITPVIGGAGVLMISVYYLATAG